MAKNCKLYEDLLVKEALGDITEKERAFLKAHLESCRECRKQLALLQDAVGTFRREELEKAPAGLAERTFHRIGAASERLAAATSSYESAQIWRPSTWRVRKSLVGWMVAASIMVMAVASLVPRVFGNGQRQMIAGCQENLKTVGTALRQYAFDHNGHYPQGPQWYKNLDWRYLKGLGAFSCPSRPAVRDPGQNAMDYVYNPDRVNIHSGEDCPLLWDMRGSHNGFGRNVLFAGGRVSWVEEDEFERILAKFGIDETKAYH